mmetsp:Transcript_27483/g.63549  ORF Transcript_27483/g.63549 Transcript_27483/m.63549 type:complete len:680 (-) Transcript_27483:51-2090(-)
MESTPTGTGEGEMPSERTETQKVKSGERVKPLGSLHTEFHATPSAAERQAVARAASLSGSGNSSTASDFSFTNHMREQPSKPLSVFLEDLPTTRRGCVRRLVLSFTWNIFMACVILTDFIIFVIELTSLGLTHDIDTESDEEQDLRLSLLYVSWGCIACYVVEVLLNMWAFGCPNYLRDRWRVVDCFVVTFSLVLVEDPSGQVVILARLGKTMRMLPVIAKMARCLRRLLSCARCGCKAFLKRRQIARMLRTLVSKSKSRFIDEKNNIDLDLAYITHDTIAFGCPVTGRWESIWRNPLPQLTRFFRLRHKGHFRIYNACPEKPYDVSSFEKIGGSVCHIKVQDHSPPTMAQLVDFLNDAGHFKKLHPKNVIAVHCKAGKGRTGTLLCAYLVYSKQKMQAEEAMKTFAKRRTDSSVSRRLRGIETPSQMRYVRAVEQHLRQTQSFYGSQLVVPVCPEPSITMKSLLLASDFLLEREKLHNIQVVVQRMGIDGVELLHEGDPVEASATEIDLAGITAAGDIRVSLFKATKVKDSEDHVNLHEELMRAPHVGKAKGIIAYFRFHTNFMPDGRVVKEGADSTCERFFLPVKEVDKACKSVRKKKHGPLSHLTIEYHRDIPAARPSRALCTKEVEISDSNAMLPHEATFPVVPAERPAHFPSILEATALQSRIRDFEYDESAEI